MVSRQYSAYLNEIGMEAAEVKTEFGNEEEENSTAIAEEQEKSVGS